MAIRGAGVGTWSRRAPRTSSTPARSEQRGAELAAVGAGAGILRTEQREEVHELLAGDLVVLDPTEQLVQLGLDAVVAPVRAHAGERRHPAGLRRLGDAGEQAERLLLGRLVAGRHQHLGEAED